MTLFQIQVGFLFIPWYSAEISVYKGSGEWVRNPHLLGINLSLVLYRHLCNFYMFVKAICVCMHVSVWVRREEIK